jgi:hypothetical protein
MQAELESASPPGDAAPPRAETAPGDGGAAALTAARREASELRARVALLEDSRARAACARGGFGPGGPSDGGWSRGGTVSQDGVAAPLAGAEVRVCPGPRAPRAQGLERAHATRRAQGRRMMRELAEEAAALQRCVSDAAQALRRPASAACCRAARWAQSRRRRRTARAQRFGWQDAAAAHRRAAAAEAARGVEAQRARHADARRAEAEQASAAEQPTADRGRAGRGALPRAGRRRGSDVQDGAGCGGTAGQARREPRAPRAARWAPAAGRKAGGRRRHPRRAQPRPLCAARRSVGARCRSHRARRAGAAGLEALHEGLRAARGESARLRAALDAREAELRGV